MGRRALVLGLAVCVIAPPVSAMSNLFGISFSRFDSSFNGVDSFIATDLNGTVVNVYRNDIPPAGTAVLYSDWSVGSEALFIEMEITAMTSGTADGVGTFKLTDVDGDFIFGDIAGIWTKQGSGGYFDGDYSNVVFTSVVNGTFDGRIGSVSMTFPALEPWSGNIYGPASGAWFDQAFETTGTLDSTVSGAMHGPVPGALVLAMLGAMSVAGLRRRGSI